jgi:hypothetical protein
MYAVSNEISVALKAKSQPEAENVFITGKINYKVSEVAEYCYFDQV